MLSSRISPSNRPEDSAAARILGSNVSAFFLAITGGSTPTAVKCKGAVVGELLFIAITILYNFCKL